MEKENFNINNLPKLHLPIGSNSFQELATSDLFIDKSLFIREIIDASEKAILITRPRRWGKTLNLQMLQAFFAPEVDEMGVVLEKNSNSIFFEGGKITLKSGKDHILKKLKIASIDNGSYTRYQGNNPVIFVNFKDIEGEDLDSIKANIAEVISDVYKTHEYLSIAIELKPHLSDGDKDNLLKFRNILNRKATEAELRLSLRFLSTLLQKHFDRTVYILVDEYDKVFNTLLEDNLGDKTQHDLRIALAGLLTAILGACGKGNDSVEKIILTGIFDTLKKEGSSGFNNVSVFGILDPGFSTSFGFTEAEINEQLLDKLNLNQESKATLNTNIKEWYNGYIVPDRHENIRVYTPWAVMKYLNGLYRGTLEPESYWSRSGSSTILSNLLSIGVDEDLRDKFNVLAQGERQILEVDNGISLFKINVDSYRHAEKIFSYLLLNSGYLTAEKIDNRYHCFVPNFEVKKEFIDCIEEQLQLYRSFRISDPFIESLVKVDEDKIRSVLTQYVYETFSNLDVPKKAAGVMGLESDSRILDVSSDSKPFTAERSYHMFVLGLLQRMTKTHIISSETDTGFGRADIMILPRPITIAGKQENRINQSYIKAEGTGFILELKRMTLEDKKNDKLTLNDLAAQGLEQIRTHKYKIKLDQHNIVNQVLMSIAFYGKEVAICIEKTLSKTFDAEVEWQYVEQRMSDQVW